AGLQRVTRYHAGAAAKDSGRPAGGHRKRHPLPGRCGADAGQRRLQLPRWRGFHARRGSWHRAQAPVLPRLSTLPSFSRSHDMIGAVASPLHGSLFHLRPWSYRIIRSVEASICAFSIAQAMYDLWQRLQGASAMHWKNTATRYGLVAIVLHWVVAVTVIGLAILGLWMVDLSYYSPYYRSAPFWHKSIGLALFAVLVLRILWRLFTPRPAHLPNHRRWERISAAL